MRLALAWGVVALLRRCLRLGTCCACALADSQHGLVAAQVRCASSQPGHYPAGGSSVPALPLAQVQQASHKCAAVSVCCAIHGSWTLAAGDGNIPGAATLHEALRHVCYHHLGRQAQWKAGSTENINGKPSLLPPAFCMSRSARPTYRAEPLFLHNTNRCHARPAAAPVTGQGDCGRVPAAARCEHAAGLHWQQPR